jgi:hypothetical protein
MPRHGVKRAKTFRREVQEGSPPVNTTNEATKVVPISGDNGKCGFVEMPAEVLLEIMSYFPAVPVPTSRQCSDTPVLPPSIFERWDILRVLSQTCRLWRSTFYPMLRERMEACAVRELKTKKPIPDGNGQTTAPVPSETQQGLFVFFLLDKSNRGS